jgi:hypothetical protein
MVQGGPGKWRDFVWLCAALVGIDLLGIFFLYPESSFTRPPIPEIEGLREVDKRDPGSKNSDEAGVTCDMVEDLPPRADNTTLHRDWVVQLSYPSIWASFLRVNPLVSLSKAFIIPIIFLLSAPVVWTVFLYGCSLASQIIMMYGWFSFSSPFLCIRFNIIVVPSL